MKRALAAIAPLCVATPAVAEPIAAPVEFKINFDRAALADPKAAREFLSHLRYQAGKACGLTTHDTLSAYRLADACRIDLVNRTVDAINAPALSKVAGK